ncbi:amidohydrolase [Heliophilum fasciatum]|uniref:Imidazolonepropionase-like amidohydrolase n=1 Tax=Heliophilum fasciatum TaxID=35700 RepID=A0A4R2RZA5_9FIRM|nr:amidohydrolase [Heliophilum fasciatum]MCW2276701.1 imidazolonepropionase-like amidohydrolase [Heliophilum fasciatum]TCP68918.1 imidazolonepropionase-like amidohydrolase [Heliophilum fasciatum]
MTTLIYGGQVWTMTGAIYDPGFLAFSEGRIVAVGAYTEEQAAHWANRPGVKRVNGSGAMLLPGFIDAHCHVGIVEEGTSIEGDDLNETSEPLTPHLRALDGINLDDPAFDDALQGGVTTVCVLPGSANVVGGQAVLLKTAGPWPSRVLREQVGLKCALGENPKRIYGEQKKSPITRMASAALLREALERARFYGQKKQCGEGECDLRWEAIQPVLERQMPLRVHAHRADDIWTALRIAREQEVDLVIEHCTEGHRIAELLSDARVPAVVGPLIVNRAKVEMREVSPATAGILHRAGVAVSLMTDHPVVPIQYLPLSAGLAVRFGLDEMAALQAITIQPARLLGLDERLGSLTVGKEADLVLWSGHPFDARSRVRHLWMAGKQLL